MPSRNSNRSAYLRYALVGTAALLLFAFLFVKGRTVDYEQHDRFQGQLRRLAAADADLTEAAFRAIQAPDANRDALRLKAETAVALAEALPEALPRFVAAEARSEAEVLILSLIHI